MSNILSDRRQRPRPRVARFFNANAVVSACFAMCLGSFDVQAQSAKPVPAPAPAIGGETVEADVSTHSIAVNSGFSGTKIVIFGAVNRPLGAAPDPSVYDVIVAVEGKSQPLVARKKSYVFGLWINVGSVLFDAAPSYYTLAATRPVNDITHDAILARHAIGFENVKLVASERDRKRRSAKDIATFADAVIRLKRHADLYQVQDEGVQFIGKSLFRSSFDLPANVPVGPLSATIYLFRDGRLLNHTTSRVDLHREGLQRMLYDLAFKYPFWYGVLAVIFAIVAGLSASSLFGRKTR